MNRNTTKLAFAAALLGATLLWPEAAMAVEEPTYTLVKKDQEFELRRYPPRLVAEVEVQGDFEDAGSRGFRPLADYIFGNNQPEEKIAMTAPVTQQVRDGEKIAMTAPVTQQQTGDRYLVQFTMPESYRLDTLPAPRNSAVKLKQIEGETVVTIRYSGFWSEDNYNDNLVKLRGRLESWGLEAVGQPTWARYDAPYKPWFLRRNEIHIPVRVSSN